MKAKTATYNNVQKLVLSLVVLGCLIFTLTVSAVEIKPTDSGSPIELSPDFDCMGSGNQLLQDNKNSTQANSKKKPGWWAWLTQTSRKPANFHYIDFMELIA